MNEIDEKTWIFTLHNLVESVRQVEKTLQGLENSLHCVEDRVKPEIDLTSIPVAAIQIGPGPASIAKIFTDLGGKIPVESGVPPGSWEIVFRPSKANPAGLVLPGGVPNRPN